MQMMIDNYEECPLRGFNGNCKVADEGSELRMVGGCHTHHGGGYEDQIDVPEDCPMRTHDVVVGVADR